MIIIGEKINGAIPSIKQAIAEKNEALIIERTIAQANAVLGNWRLEDCVLYVTLEPCPMCAGAIVNARIRRVIVGAKDAKAGAMGSLMNVNFYPLNHHPAVEFGVLERECADILREFFLRLREKRRGK